MARQLTSLTVFVSAPSELEAEKAALRIVLGDLNAILEKTHGITLRLVGWPDDFRPAVSTDPQSAINEQLGEYDIYVGLLGVRFGTPTPRAASGTEEEFQEALRRLRADPSSLRVLLYFKRDEQDAYALDLDQLKKVRDFREGLGSQGVLYQDIASTAAFAEVARRHIHHLVLDEWRNGRWRDVDVRAQDPRTVERPRASVEPEGTEAGAKQVEPEPPIEEEQGFLELFEEYERAARAVVQVMERISEHTVRVGALSERRTAELTLLLEEQQKVERLGGSRAQQDHVAKGKEILNQSADDLAHFAADIDADVQEFKAENRAMFRSLTRAIAEQRELDMPSERLNEDRATLERLVANTSSTIEHVTNFQQSIARTPPLTSNLKRARRRASAAVGELIAELQLSIEGARQAIQMLSASIDHQEGE